MHDRPASERLTPIVVAWAIGSWAAIAQTWDGTLWSWMACCALGVVGAAILWLLSTPPVRLTSWRTLLVGSIVAAVAVGAALTEFMRAFTVTVVGVTLAFGALVRWPLITFTPRRASPAMPFALSPLIAAMVIWFRDPAPILFAALSILTVVLLEAASRRPQIAAAAERTVQRIAAGAAAGLSAVLATISMVLFVVPVAWLSRLVGYSPLRSGWVSDRSAWIRVASERTRTAGDAPVSPRRTSARDLPLTSRARSRAHLRWVALICPLLIAVLLSQLLSPGQQPSPLTAARPTGGAAAGPSVPDGEDPAEGSTQGGGTFTSSFEDDPAFEDAPWAADLRRGLLDSWQNLEFTTSGWRLRNGQSQYINVEAGERRTIDPDPELGPPMEVWFFGGSAAFGAGQRDEHTIPSELVRLANDDGLPLRIRNFGVPATVNWQSMVLFTEKLKWDARPDLVIFYDGANDLALQGVLAAQGRGNSSRPASLFDAEFDSVLRERAAPVDIDGATRSEDPEPVAPATPNEMGAIASERYLRGVDVVRLLANSEGVPTEFFWQPQLPTKDPSSEADRDTLRRINFDDSAIGWARDMSGSARLSLVPAGIHDLTEVLDGRDEPLYWDAVHTNEVGAKIVAVAMFEVLRPTLDRASPP